MDKKDHLFEKTHWFCMGFITAMEAELKKLRSERPEEFETVKAKIIEDLLHFSLKSFSASPEELTDKELCDGMAKMKDFIVEDIDLKTLVKKDKH